MHRLEVARRAGELLDEKRAALLREEGVLRVAATTARADLVAALADAERWWARATLLGGRRGARLAAATAVQPAALDVTWTVALGVRRPVATLAEPDGEVPGLVGAGGVALPEAATAYRRVLQLAVAAAEAESAQRAVAAELARTTRRLRAIEWRWIPQHEHALVALDVALDEAERADAARVRWAVRAAAARDAS